MKRRVAVIGGGASGLAAALTAARAGAEVLILERLPRVGKKLLLTGNGRCNLFHEPLSFSHYHGTVPQAAQILAQFDADGFFRSIGLMTRTDSEGRQYPYSMTAASVLDALRLTAEQCGVKTVCGSFVRQLCPAGEGWTIRCETADGNKEYAADSVIVAAGGSAAPSCGTDGNLFGELMRLGHKIVKPLPTLCPVPVSSTALRQLKGMRMRAAVSALKDGKTLKTETGEVQFSENALSGICVFNLSRLAAVYGSQLTLSLDFLPEMPEDALCTLLRALAVQRGGMTAADLLTGLLPKRIGEVLLKSCGIAPSANCRETCDHSAVIQQLAALCKDWRFPVSGTAGFAQAQVTAGGVSGQSVTKTLASKVQKNLWFCGEVLDIDGDCGGYNLAWAWSSGVLAGVGSAGGEPPLAPAVPASDDLKFLIGGV